LVSIALGVGDVDDLEKDVLTARWTYQYLRFSLLAVVLGLFIAIAIEWMASSCLQRSISAYYYTPVQAVFVGAVVAMGVAMVVILGRNGVEDAFLNLAGLLAPIVAFVPTSDANRCSLVDAAGERGGTPAQEVVDATRTAIDNNVVAYFVLFAVGLVAMSWLTRSKQLPDRPVVHEDRRPYRISLVLAILALAVGVGTYAFMRDGFYAHAHFVSASSLFGCVIVVVYANAYDRANKQSDTDASSPPVGGLAVARRRDPYAALGGLMILAVVIIGGLGRLTEWEYWVLVLEATLIGLFGVFWLIQTWEYFRKLVDVAPTDGARVP